MRLIAIFKPYYGVLRWQDSFQRLGVLLGPAGQMANPWYEIAQMACLPARYKRNGDSEKVTERLSRGQLSSNFSKYIHVPARG